MEFSINHLLESFTDEKLVAPKAIEKKLGISDSANVRKLQVALDALEKVGMLEKDKGRYRRLSEEGFVEGRLRCSSKGFCFAIQDVEGAEDIYIRESRLSNAWNGDRVLVKITKDGIRRRSPEGEVRLIVERANPTLLAKVKALENGYRAIPLDDRLLFEIDLKPDEETSDLSDTVDKLIHLEMLRYPLGSHLPIGRVAQILGSDAESTADVDLVCCKHNLPRRFGDKANRASSRPRVDVTEALGSLPKSLKKADLKNRADLREVQAVSIGDAAAISLVATESGWDLGVHIPDVAAYVTPGSALDEVARNRLRTYYLGETILTMLPELNILDQPEHLAISALLKLDREGALISFEVQPTVVNVPSKPSYTEAQAILNQPDLDSNSSEIAGVISSIATLSPLLQQQRHGSFHITMPQVALQGSDESIHGTVVTPEALPIYGMVAEILILTNRAIATHLASLELPAIFCTHSTPEVNKISDWLRLFECMGVTVELNQPDQVQSLDYHAFLSSISQIEDPHRRDILKHLLLSLLKPEEYSLSPGLHFGLALSSSSPYTHAVSPQHRYSDLLVQRVLHYVFEEGRDRRTSRNKEGVDLHSSSCHGQVNWSVLPPERERQLQAEHELLVGKLTHQDAVFYKAKADLEGLQKAEYMRTRTGQNFFGIITGVQTYGFFVEIESLLVEGLVHVSSLKDDWYEFPQSNSKAKSRASTVLVGRRSSRQYRLGDRVEVQVKSVDYYRQQIDLVAVASTEATDETNDRSPNSIESDNIVISIDGNVDDYNEIENDSPELIQNLEEFGELE